MVAGHAEGPDTGLLFGAMARPGLTEVTGFQQAALSAVSIQAAEKAKGKPAGFYRVIRDGPLALNEEDLRLAHSHFQDPGCVFLLIQPEGAAAKACFFFWDNGHIHGDLALMEIPFERQQLAAAERQRQSSLAYKAQVAPASPSPPSNQPTRGSRWSLPMVVLAFLTGAGTPTAYFYWTRGPSAPPNVAAAPSTPVAGAPAAGTGFAASPEGAMWRLTWNRGAVAAMRPSGATLSIHDGEHEQQIPLTEADLAGGTMKILYTAQSADFSFGFTVLSPNAPPVEERVRVQSAVQPPPATTGP